MTEMTPSGEPVFSLSFYDELFSYRADPIPFGQVSRGELRAGMDSQYRDHRRTT